MRALMRISGKDQIPKMPGDVAMMCIENRVPWVRSTNTGVSIIVAAEGQPLTQASELGQINAGSARVFIPMKTSIYSQIGDWFVVLLFIVWLLYYALRSSGNPKER